MRLIEDIGVGVPLSGPLKQAKVPPCFRCSEFHRLIVLHLSGDEDGSLSRGKKGTTLAAPDVVLRDRPLHDYFTQFPGSADQFRRKIMLLGQAFGPARLTRVVVDASTVGNEGGRRGRGRRRARR